MTTYVVNEFNYIFLVETNTLLIRINLPSDDIKSTNSSSVFLTSLMHSYAYIILSFILTK